MNVDLLDGTTISVNGGPAVPMAQVREALDQVQGKRALKETPEDVAVRERLESSAADELRAFIERYEHLDAEIADLKGDAKEVMSEAKGRGYDTKVLRKIIAMRKRDKDSLAEEEAILALYKTALGMV